LALWLYIARRLAVLVPTLFFVSIMIFSLQQLLPGDAAVALAGEEHDPAAVAAIRARYHLDRPIPVQYGIWLGRVLRGDFGESLRSRIPVRELLASKLPVTIELAVCSMAIALLIGIPAGIVSAVRKGTMVDVAANLLALSGLSVPHFWLGIMLILLFGVALRWLPTSGFESWRHLILPAVTLAAFPMALVARLTRSSMLEILGRDYIRTGRAKGLAERAVVLRHALRNAAVPVLTVLGLQIGTLLGGAVITESVFAWPGMGKLVVDAIFFRDFPVVQTVLIFSATIFVLINLLVDLLYTVIDPRIRYS
jgi:peptide/nickel transport system permease protein